MTEDIYNHVQNLSLDDNHSYINDDTEEKSCNSDYIVPSLVEICATKVSNVIQKENSVDFLPEIVAALFHLLDDIYDVNSPLGKLKKKLLNLVHDRFALLLKRYGREALEEKIPNELMKRLLSEYEEQQKIRAKFAALKGTILEPQIVEFNKDDVEPGCYPLAALLQGMKWPDDVIPNQREEYLSEKEFFQVFEMTKEEFQKLSKEKRIRLKKLKSLF